MDTIYKDTRTKSTNNTHKTGVINDPLGKTHSLASRNIVFAWNLCYEKWDWTYGRHVPKQWSLPAVTVGWLRGSTSLALFTNVILTNTKKFVRNTRYLTRVDQNPCILIFLSNHYFIGLSKEHTAKISNLFLCNLLSATDIDILPAIVAKSTATKTWLQLCSPWPERKACFLIHEADPQAQPVVITIFERGICTSHFSKSLGTNYFQVRIMIATGGTVGLVWPSGLLMAHMSCLFSNWTWPRPKNAKFSCKDSSFLDSRYRPIPQLLHFQISNFFWE